MKMLIRISEMLLRILFWAVVVTACCALFSCRTVQYVPVETIKTETERVVDIQRDSIYILDSVFVREANDTIYITKWRVEYKEALRVDTLNVERIDTLITIVEVEKRLTKWQQTKMDVGAGVLYAVSILTAVGLFVLYRKLKK
ncbi:MAG: hypothetical protein J6V00_05235 [Bacteroidaceae bacterium]|nr:hypothetical protein [Bacteroidaceae bacterium]